jgi:hypothetical protein
MLVTTIAQLDLSKNDPTAFQKADRLTSYLGGILSHGISDSFIESACWADDIRDFGLDAMTTWHYIDKPYNPEKEVNPDVTGSGNCLWFLHEIMATLQSPTRNNSILETALMMRWLVHIIGDMHQPLHTVSMFSSLFPDGDAGGNLFKIQYNQNITQLHAFWDSGCGQYADDPIRPLEEGTLNYLMNEAEEIMKDYTRDDLESDLEIGKFEEWVSRNYEVAKNKVYKGVEYGQLLNESYIEEGRELVRRQIALAGYRLSDLIQKIYSYTRYI